VRHMLVPDEPDLPAYLADRIPDGPVGLASPSREADRPVGLASPRRT